MLLDAVAPGRADLDVVVVVVMVVVVVDISFIVADTFFFCRPRMLPCCTWKASETAESDAIRDSSFMRPCVEC